MSHLPRSSHFAALGICALSFAAACAPAREAAAGRDSAAAVASAAPAAPAAMDTPAPDSAAGDVTGAADSSVPPSPADTGAKATPAPVTAKVPSGRSARDSTALVRAIRAGRKQQPWPSGPAAAGGVLPRTRIVAYYGNPLSKRMGVLGEYETDEMLRRLDAEVARWRRADPSTPVKPALHLVAVTAQGAAGSDGKYRLRMDSALIAKVYGWAKQKDALLFLDVQVGWSTLEAEIPRLERWLAMPDIHLGIDPEFAMHGDREGVLPGKKIGTFDARDVNYAIRTLSDIAARHKVPPKLLVVHRFTRKMVSNAGQIRLDPRVQVIMDMDGWGPPWLKFDSYTDYIVAEPVQFTGFKLFYHNDARKGDALLTPGELVQLVPAPLYIQYQ